MSEVAYQDAIGFSYNYATAKPNIGLTEKKHILGLCSVLERVGAERDALAAHVGRMKASLHRLSTYPDDCDESDYRHAQQLVQESPAGSLARLKAQWQAEALEEVAMEWRRDEMDQGETDCVEYLERKARRIRHQAEGGEA